MRNNEYTRDVSGCFAKKPADTQDPTFSITPIPSRIYGGPPLANTRPSSSLSNFELIDDVQFPTPTPFELTPSASPAKEPPVEIPKDNPPIQDGIMAMEHVDPFHGRG